MRLRLNSLLLLILLTPTGLSQNIQLVETDQALTVARGEKTILVYNKVSPSAPEGIELVYERSGFIHPFFAPNDQCVTAAFPVDHPHQHGIFSAWVDTTYGDRTIDFWNLAKGTGDVRHAQVLMTSQEADSVVFKVALLHRGTQAPAVDIVREHWLVRVHDRGADSYCFDIESSQWGLTDLPLMVNKYHYGGMAFRGRTDWLLPNDGYAKQHPELQLSPVRLINHKQEDRLAGNHTPTDWVALTGQAGGGEGDEAGNEAITLVVFSHPSNFRAPQPARLHPTKPYFCFSPCVNEPFLIEKDQPLTSKYRFLIQCSQPDSAWIDEEWKRWSE